MPYVKFICVRCGYKERCEARLHINEYKGELSPPLCFQGLIDVDGNDLSEFELVGVKIDEV